MNTSLIFLIFLTVPSFAKLVWKKPIGVNMVKVDEALKDFDLCKGVILLEVGNPEPSISGSNKMIAMLQEPSEDNQPVFFYMPMVTDAEENVHFDGFVKYFLTLRIAKAYAEFYANTLAFKCVWEYTRYYYRRVGKMSPHTPAPVDVNSAYRIPYPTVIMTYKTEDGRVGVVHTTKKEYDYLFTVWLYVDGYYRLIHTSEQIESLYDTQRALWGYLKVPVQWAEPWQEVGKDFSAINSAILDLSLQLESASGVNRITLQKIKGVREDPLKFVAFCRGTSPSIPILAIVTARTEGGRTFDFNYIYKASKEDECVEQRLQEYLSQQAFPLTNDWKKVTGRGNEVKDIEIRIKEKLETMYKTVQTCSVVQTRNVGSAYREKAAIVYIEANKPENKIHKKFIYVAWTESDEDLLIKSIGEVVSKVEEAVNQFNFYGKLPFAYTESKFENGVGWYSKEQVPIFIREEMETIMQDLQELKPNIQVGYEIEDNCECLQDAGHISAKISEEEGGLYFRLKVKRKKNVVETVDVMFIHGRYISTN